MSKTCVDKKFSKTFKSYFGDYAVYDFISIIIEESKYCSDVMKKHFNKELVMTNEDNEDFENSTKCWICKNNSSVQRDCNINVKLNHKIPVVFHNLKKYDSLLIMQELVKLNLKTNVIPKRLEKYMSFNINSKLGFIDNFQFPRSSLDILVKT